MSGFPSDEDRDAEIVRRVGETKARDAAEGAAAAAGDAQEVLRDVIVEARELRKKIAYDRAVKTIENPAAKVAELTSKLAAVN